MDSRIQVLLLKVKFWEVRLYEIVKNEILIAKKRPGLEGPGLKMGICYAEQLT